MDSRSGRSTGGGGARRLAALWLALAALGAVAHAYAVPVDDPVAGALDAFDDADDDELALDQEVRVVTDQRELGESRKRVVFQIIFISFVFLPSCFILGLISQLAFIWRCCVGD